MKYYLAPMEGLTTYTYRNLYHKHFHPMDKYYTPFIVPHRQRSFKAKELKEILPEHNKGLFVVPQLLTNNAEDFVRTAKEFREYGYEEINLNLGCPSGTVTAKRKGSGLLAYPEELERMLDEIFEHLDMKVSIKTRIGVEEPGEWERLLEIYNRYPISELIVHPRVQKDYYKNSPHMEAFKMAVKNSKNPICYNGDLFSMRHYERFLAEYPDVQAVMLGRGIFVNPALVNQICGEKGITKEKLSVFHDELYAAYSEILFGDRALLFRMKEMWFYMIHLFSNHEKYAKKIKKAERLAAYEQAVKNLFEEQEILEVFR